MPIWAIIAVIWFAVGFLLCVNYMIRLRPLWRRHAGWANAVLDFLWTLVSAQLWPFYVVLDAISAFARRVQG